MLPSQSIRMYEKIIREGIKEIKVKQVDNDILSHYDKNLFRR